MDFLPLSDFLSIPYTCRYTGAVKLRKLFILICIDP